MCDLKRRDFLLGTSAILFFGCADSENYEYSDKYNEGKDYYPVSSSRLILHWGKNNRITIDSDSTGSPTTAQVDAFEAGVNQWSNTLSEIGVTLSYSGTPDVKVHWYTASEMESQTGSSSVLGYASSNKNIYMRKDLDSTYGAGTIQSTAVHEFGHMLGVWTHSFDAKDIMYPYATSVTELSNRDKKTVTDFLYAMTPTYDMHDVSGPLINPENGAVMPHIQTYYTTSGCVVSTDQ